jgi:hypothetical protein
MINANRGNYHAGNKIKKTETEFVRLTTLNKTPFKTPCRLKFTWLIKDRKTDPDNSASAKKQILDGLVKSKIIPNDTHRYLLGFQDEFELSDKAGVRIEVIE